MVNQDRIHGPEEEPDARHSDGIPDQAGHEPDGNLEPGMKCS